MKRTQDHDGRQKLLLSNPQMVKDLLAFVDEPWVGELDFSTLKQAESTLMGRGQDGEPVRRESDLLWRVKTRGGQPIYVYLLIELQSTVDRSMPLRLLVYVAHLYHRLYWEGKERGPDGLLPPVVPFVLYNGERKWTAVRDVVEMISPGPKGLEALRPRLSHVLIDERRQEPEKLAKLGNLFAAMVRLETGRGEGMREILSGVLERLNEPGREQLKADFFAWLNDGFLAGHFPPGESPVASTFEELVDMLPEGVKPWYQEWRDEGRQEGRQEGRREGVREGLEKGRRKGVREGLRKGKREGKREGELRLLERQLTVRFGKLPAEVRGRLQKAPSKELLRWAERCLTARTLDDVFSE